MNSTRRMLLGMMVLAGIWVGHAWPQDGPPHRGEGPRPKQRGHAMSQLGSPQDPARTIEMVRMYRMVEALRLSEEQCQTLFPIITQANRERRDRQRNLDEALRSLRISVQNDNQTEAELSAKVRQMRELIQAQRSSDERLLDELIPHLSPRQQAEFILFHHDFERQIRELLQKVRRDEAPSLPPRLSEDHLGRRGTRPRRPLGDGPPLP